MGLPYLQWSRAAELAILGNNSDACNEYLGRGALPVLEHVSLAGKSSSRIIEHHIWSLPSAAAAARPDLYSTLWAAISGIIHVAGSSIRVDINNCKNVESSRWRRLYFSFLQYLLNDDKGPLMPSLAKLQLDAPRWRQILEWPVAHDTATLHQLGV